MFKRGFVKFKHLKNWALDCSAKNSHSALFVGDTYQSEAPCRS